MSSSLAETQPSPVADDLRICLFRASLFFDVSFFESASSSYQGCFSSGKITAPTTSGPARGPRPTSSIPRIGTYFASLSDSSLTSASSLVSSDSFSAGVSTTSTSAGSATSSTGSSAGSSGTVTSFTAARSKSLA